MFWKSTNRNLFTDYCTYRAPSEGVPEVSLASKRPARLGGGQPHHQTRPRRLARGLCLVGSSARFHQGALPVVSLISWVSLPFSSIMEQPHSSLAPLMGGMQTTCSGHSVTFTASLQCIFESYHPSAHLPIIARNAASGADCRIVGSSQRHQRPERPTWRPADDNR